MRAYTPYISMALCFTLALVSVNLGYAAAIQKEAGVVTPMKYEGGSLPLNQHDKLETFVNKDEVVLMQGQQRFVIPVKSITGVSYSVVNIISTSVSSSLLTEISSPLIVKTEDHFVGIVWTTGKSNTRGVVFRVGSGEYRGFMASLEGLAGVKAVNADAVGSGGTSRQ